MKESRRALQRVVFAGAAVPRTVFDMLPPDLRSRNLAHVINVYSDADQVLKGLYPMLHDGGQDAAGISPVKRLGVTNVKVDAGHLTYPQLARQLRDLAVRR